MKILRQNSLRNAIAAFVFANISALCIPQQTFAQPTPDATLPIPSFVDNTNAPVFRIIDGTTAGTNLFHSFSQFSLLNGETAFFDNLPAIQNILVRVTGNTLSSIDGVISANGTANLFLINPNGIVFGQNASLDIGGSFLATTANSIRFLDGSEFRANANTQITSPLLLVSIPVGLQFNGLINSAIALSGSPFLFVPLGKTLALVGGDITLQGAYLYAESGRIELGSVAGNGYVAIAQTANDLILNYNQAPNLGNIRLEQAAIADTSGSNGGGDIQVQGRQVTLEDGSQLLSLSSGNGNGGEVFVRATELFAVIGESNTSFSSGIFTDTGRNSSGNSGNITIATERLELTNGGKIAAATLGSGNGGNIRINANEILLTGMSGFSFSGIFAPVFGTNTTGNGGNIIVTTDNLLIDEYGWIASDTLGSGNAGNIEITAKNINLITNNNQDNTYALISSGVYENATGNGGLLKITTDNLQLIGSSILAASTLGIGNAGNIDITAKNIILDASNADFAADIFNGSLGDATGNGGDIKITADNILLKNGGQISVDTQSDRNGNGGNLLINAKSIDIFGQNNSVRSGLFANAVFGTGNGGNIEINSDRLLVRDGGIISASNFIDQKIFTQPESAGSGLVGNITINSPSILLDKGSINIDSLSGSRGNINLNSSLILLRNGSTISTNALGSATGGNITINTDFLVAVPTENSDITANSFSSFGGRVIITAQGVIGFQFVNRLTPLSDITATSALGTQFNGLVEIRTPDTDLSRGLVKLPDTLTDANKQIVAACDRIRDNEFIITGRGGVPPDATKVISSQAIWRDLRLSEIPSTPSNITTQTEPNLLTTQPTQPVAIQPIPQIEAQGWQKDRNGNLKLLALAASPSDPVWRFPVICPAKK
jgi:filamentous hemagglutinin family protein